YTGRAEAANDDRGPAIDERIEAPAQRVIPGIARGDDRTRHGPLEFRQDRFVHWTPILVPGLADVARDRRERQCASAYLRMTSPRLVVRVSVSRMSALGHPSRKSFLPWPSTSDVARARTHRPDSPS